MLEYFIKRLIQMIPVVLGVILVVFLIMQLVPGDPARVIAGEDAPAEAVEVIRHKLGLDRPLLLQYLSYIGDVARGDFGESYRSGMPVLELIRQRLPTTLTLAGASITVTIIVGLTAGILAAVKQNSKADIFVMITALLGVSLPIFWVGLLLMYFFAVKWMLLPVAGWGTWKHVILPAVTLGMHGAAAVARMTRSSMLEVIRQDYIRTAHAKGLSESVVIYKHALKNALVPVITIIGVQMGVLLGGSVVTESVFAINGLGRLIVDAIKLRDIPVVQGGVLVASVIFILVNLAVDMLYKVLNKRIDLS